jgi:hypothetical protein
MKRINNDVNGNPRYVVHFYDLLRDGEGEGLDVFEKYKIAVKKSRKIGGKIYKGKDFGGCIVFQSYDIQATVNLVKSI